MNRRITQKLAVGFGAIAVLAGSTTHAMAAEHTQKDAAKDPAAYVEYLRHSHEAGAASTLKAFESLAPSEQNKFIGYLHDTTLFKSFMDRTAKQPSGLTAFSRNTQSSVSLKNGDVTFVSQRTISGVAAAKPLGRGNHAVAYNVKLKIHGI